MRLLWGRKSSRRSGVEYDSCASGGCWNYEGFVSTASLRLRDTNFLCTSAASRRGISAEMTLKRHKTLAISCKLLILKGLNIKVK